MAHRFVRLVTVNSVLYGAIDKMLVCKDYAGIFIQCPHVRCALRILQRIAAFYVNSSLIAV